MCLKGYKATGGKEEGTQLLTLIFILMAYLLSLEIHTVSDINTCSAELPRHFSPLNATFIFTTLSCCIIFIVTLQYSDAVCTPQCCWIIYSRKIDSWHFMVLNLVS